jgi:hypothetical protein
MLWSVVLVFFAAASLCATDANPGKAKPKQGKAPVAKATTHHAEKDPFARAEKHPASSPKKYPRPILKALRPEENVARIEAALAGPTELCFVEAPLTDVIDYLKELHKIEIQIDNKTLEEAGVGTDVPVTVNLKGISLRSALNLMLKKLNLTWLIANEVLMITTVEDAENQLQTKVYDVADLVVCRDEHDVITDDYDSLTDMITSTIKPTSWDGVGGPGSVTGESLGTAKVLIVAQTQDVQDELAKLLAEIREVGKKTPHAGLPRHDMSAEKEKEQSVQGDADSSAAAATDGAKKSDGTAAKQEKQPSPPEKPNRKEGGKGAF